MKHTVSAIIFGLFLILVLSSAAMAESLAIEADSLEFSSDGQSFTADGHVSLTYQDITIHADQLTGAGKTVSAHGNVILSTPTGRLEADWVEIDLETQAFSAAGIHGRMGDLYLRADKITPGSKLSEKILENADLTMCDLPTPCYSLQAGRIIIDDGHLITVEHGWLALKEHRVLPLPRLSLDIDKLDDWPDLSLGYDDTRGMYVGARVTIPITGTANLRCSGQVAAKDPFNLSATLNWRPAENLLLSPWASYSVADGASAGVDASLNENGWTAGLSADYGWEDLSSSTRLSLKVPVMQDLSLEGFYSVDRTEPGPSEFEGGVSLRWSAVQDEDDRTALGLTLGRSWTDSDSGLLLEVEASLNRRINEDWGFNANMAYDIAGTEWSEGSFGLTRYLHCYFLQLGYDWTSDTFALTGGLTF